MVIVESLIKNEVADEKRYKYYYRLLKNELTISDSQDADIVQCYGIEIERQDIVDDSIINIERDCVERISPYRHKVHSLLKLLYDNTVSPIHMVDIIGESIDEYAEGFEDVSKNTSTC